ncbi:unnamed protein product [Prorocentrum cordatum]|uniref:Decapping nuclease n=1 Tax=Prorocentrum cordatum TaxID=2364126 RepID=A0ABN9TW01_9DINO|nr:unnamed protein product [Polarella glacialis]
MLFRRCASRQSLGVRRSGEAVYDGACRIQSRKRVLVISASICGLHEKPTETQRAFVNVGLLTLSPNVRGSVLEAATRNIVRDMYPRAAIEDALPGLCVNGVQRSQHMANYDWLMDGRRVECKSSALSWESNRKSWSITFRGIKAARMGVRAQSAFDELILSFCSPRRLYIYRHDGAYSFSTNGVQSLWSGDLIRIRGPRNEVDWQLALRNILAKLDGSRNGCERLADVPLWDDRISEAIQQASCVRHLAYVGVPLSTLDPSTRALRIHCMMREVDTMLYPKASFTDPELHPCIDGLARGHWQSQQDYAWVRDGLRVQCRSAGMTWDMTNKRWYVRFSHIRFHLFDELKLAIWSPAGIFVLQHNMKFGVSKSGSGTALAGHCITVTARCNDHDCVLALRCILQKLDDASCALVAQLNWP